MAFLGDVQDTHKKKTMLYIKISKVFGRKFFQVSFGSCAFKCDVMYSDIL